MGKGLRVRSGFYAYTHGRQGRQKGGRVGHLDLLRAEIGLHIFGQAALPPPQLLDAVHALLTACTDRDEQQGTCLTRC